MKGRPLILIFLFLISLQTVCAESHIGEVDLQLSEDAPDWSLLDAHTGGCPDGISIVEFQYKGVADAGIPNTLVFRDASMSKEAAYSWTNIPQNVGGSFALYDNGVFAGTGGITIHRVNDVDVGRVDIWYMFDDTDFVANTSETTMDVSLYASPINEYYDKFNVDYWGNPYTTQNVYMRLKYSTSYSGTHASYSAGGSSYVEYDYYGHFINEYNITLSGATASTVITRDGLGQQLSSSRLKLTNSTGSVVYLPSSYSTTNSTHNHDNGSYYYYLDVENYGDVLIYEGMGSAPPHTGDIEFNQTFYTDPEDIQVSWDVDSFDSDAYTYEIQIITSVSGEFSQDSWPADGNWNVSPFISSASGAAVFDFYSDSYDLPVWIQGELWAQEMSSGTWTKLDNTPAVKYYENIIQGKISTDNSSYNVSEIVTVTYTSYADDIKIRAYQHGSITTYWYNDLPSGIDKTIKITFDEKDRGSWDLRLIENDVFTNWTSIEITSGDTPYVKWYQSVYTEGQIASYRIGGSGGLMLYSTDVNATLSIFDAAGTEIYNFSVGSGNNNMQINFAESAAPGMWTASLLDLGFRYNDTTMVTSIGSVLRFNSSSYELGDTIGINYFIPSSNYRIMLIDGNFKEIIIFTTQNGVISTGTYQTLPFSLVDNNEYGFNMIAAIDAGTYATGYWEVWVVDQYGTFLDNGTVWDRAKVSKSSGDSTDTSNEMISIFFSPEGVFMLYTVCLTMMGLVLAKHPAGGGAGATVGVGFGTYFNVLPVWMLMLTVILLVVMAGVSIAVYYKGK